MEGGAALQCCGGGSLRVMLRCGGLTPSFMSLARLTSATAAAAVIYVLRQPSVRRVPMNISFHFLSCLQIKLAFFVAIVGVVLTVLGVGTEFWVELAPPKSFYDNQVRHPSINSPAPSDSD